MQEKSLVSASAVVVYVTGLIIGSLFGVVAGIVSLIAIVFAVKLFKYSRNNPEPAEPLTSAQ